MDIGRIKLAILERKGESIKFKIHQSVLQLSYSQLIIFNMSRGTLHLFYLQVHSSVLLPSRLERVLLRIFSP